MQICEPSRFSKGSNMHPSLIVAAVLIGTGLGSKALAQSAKDIRGPSPLIAIENEPPARLIVDLGWRNYGWPNGVGRLSGYDVRPEYLFKQL